MIAIRNARPQHHARTCAELHVHANTLYQRLERIGQLLGPDWRAPDRALDMQFAPRLHALSDTLAAGDEPAVPGDAPAALRP